MTASRNPDIISGKFSVAGICAGENVAETGL
jgi:hypothetical protein